MKKRQLLVFGLSMLAAAISIGFYLADQRDGGPISLIPSAEAAAEKAEPPSPVEALPDREIYYPGSETLGPNEMRVIACGTGMPNARPKQAAACWLVELGNGDKFIFDIGTGSAERLSALKIPYDYLDKVFLGHLLSDHFGDMDALWVGGVVGNRVNPMRVWGPKGHKPEYGTAYAIEHMEKMLTWDKGSRLGNVDIRGLFLNIPIGQTGFYTLTELQTISDLKNGGDWEVWIGPEFGKVLKPGRIIYAKPGFGISADQDEREWSFELGYRHFF